MGVADWIGREPPLKPCTDTFARIGGEWRLLHCDAGPVQAIVARDKRCGKP